MLLFWGGLASPQFRGQLLQVWPAVVVWLAILGGIASAFGRSLSAAVEKVLLPDQLSPAARRLYLCAIGMACLAVLQYHVANFLLRYPTDLPSFLLAARAMAAGQDFYDPQVIATFADAGASRRAVYPYLYLPFYAVLLWPLSLLPLATGHAFFLIFNALLWPLLVYLCLRLIETPRHLRAPLAAVLLIAVPSFFPAIQTLHHGSPSLLVAVLVVAVLVLEREDRSWWAGLLLALAMLIKIIPVILIPYFLMRRRHRILLSATIAATVMMGASLAIAGLGPHLHWLTEMAPGLSSGGHTASFFEPGCHPENQSLTGVFCNLLGASSSSSSALSSATRALVVLLAGLALWRREHPAIDRLEGALVTVSIMMASTITWFHHMTMMLLPALTLIVVGAEGKGLGRRMVLACGFFVLIVVGFKFYLDPWPFIVSGPLIHTIRFQAIFVAYLALLVLVWRGGCSDPSDPEPADSSAGGEG